MSEWLDTRCALALVATVFVFGTVACSDDPGQNNQQSENQRDLDAGTDTDGDADSADSDAGDGGTTDATDATDTEDAVPIPDVEPVECYYGSEDPECGAGEFGPGTFFTEFVIETDDEEDACCFDLTGDGIIDNYLGEEIASAVSNIEGFTDINENISNSIWAGELIYLLEAAHWEHPLWDNDIELNVLMGSYSDDDMNTNMAGEGSFWVDPSNYGANDEPRMGFDQAMVLDGQLEADDGFLEIRMPGLVEGLGAPFGDVRMTGTVVQEPAPDLTAEGDFAITDGKLGGALLRDRFFRSLNEVSYDCECFDTDFEDPENPDPWTEGVFEYNPDHGNHGRWQCHEKGGTDPAECTGAGNPPACQTLADNDLCFILDSLSQNPDMEVQGQPGYSIGVHFETVTTEIVGVGNEQ